MKTDLAATAPHEPLRNHRNCAQAVGAIVVGGDHPGLAVARSLGRRGIPVYVLDHEHSLSHYSRYVTKVIRVNGLLHENEIVESVLATGQKYGLRDWVLFPTRDEHVMAFSQHRNRLAEFFRVPTPEWETTRWMWDKNNTHRLAAQLGISSPQTWNVGCDADLTQFYSKLPLAIKPAVKEHFFYSTGAKAWRADTPERLHHFFRAAASQIDVSEIMIQEIIPGGGDCQYSYCSFFRNGVSHSSLAARRMRQHPREFGRAATYVETIQSSEIEELSERFLRAINFYGIVEIEYKKDPRDGQFKILDVNPRAWGFHALGRAAGVDFPYLLFADQVGYPIEPSRGRAHVGWLRFVTDTPAATAGMLQGHLSLGDYLRSLGRTRVESVFYMNDPLPSLAEFALLPYFIVKRLYKVEHKGTS
jgi:D-aspartate ligase